MQRWLLTCWTRYCARSRPPVSHWSRRTAPPMSCRCSAGTPGNWDCAFPAPSPVAFAAVMRSWEERFGARLFALTQDQAYLLVGRPPPDLDAALLVAAEHFVFCDEPAGRQPV